MVKLKQIGVKNSKIKSTMAFSSKKFFVTWFPVLLCLSQQKNPTENRFSSLNGWGREKNATISFSSVWILISFVFGCKSTNTHTHSMHISTVKLACICFFCFYSQLHNKMLWTNKAAICTATLNLEDEWAERITTLRFLWFRTEWTWNWEKYIARVAKKKHEQTNKRIHTNCT